jgi:prepilin-type N-terminal cleavage/methylation domain-containing protein
MRKKNGFTLTEILVTIAMIAVLGTIIIYSTIGVTNSSKENQYKRMIENIKNSAKTYVSLYPDEFGDLFSSKAFTYISLNQLISAGLLDEELVNPYTKEPIDTNQECNS